MPGIIDIVYTDVPTIQGDFNIISSNATAACTIVMAFNNEKLTRIIGALYKQYGLGVYEGLPDVLELQQELRLNRGQPPIEFPPSAYYPAISPDELAAKKDFSQHFRLHKATSIAEARTLVAYAFLGKPIETFSISR